MKAVNIELGCYSSMYVITVMEYIFITDLVTNSMKLYVWVALVYKWFPSHMIVSISYAFVS